MHWMSKTALCVVAAAVLAVAQSAQAEEIVWQAGFFKAMKAAEEKKRPVLVFATMEGCHFCEQMHHEAYKDKKIASTLNSDFIPVRLDAYDSEDLLDRMGVQVYPTTIIFSPKGKRLGTIEGYEAKSVLDRALRGALRYQLASSDK